MSNRTYNDHGRDRRDERGRDNRRNDDDGRGGYASRTQESRSAHHSSSSFFDFDTPDDRYGHRHVDRMQSNQFPENSNTRGGQTWGSGVGNVLWGSTMGGRGDYERQSYPPRVPNPFYSGGNRGGGYDAGRGYDQSRTATGGYDQSRPPTGAYDRRSDGQSRSWGGGGSRAHGRGMDHHAVIEQRRVEISATSNAHFLEEVNLPAEFAFRLDTSADVKLLANESTGFRQKSSFITTFYKDNLLGATDEYIKKNNIRSYLAKKPEEIDLEEPEPEVPGTSTPKRANGLGQRMPKSAEFISVARPRPAKSIGRGGGGEELELEDRKGEMTTDERREQFNLATRKNPEDKKGEMTTDEKREQFNVATRKNPEDIGMWRDFVDFQDEDCLRLHKKAKVEKKLSILEKALRTNPRSSELHFHRLDLMNEILKSSDVLDEWEKLLQANLDSEVIWMERFNYAATQLQLYTSSALNKEFEKGFSKLRTMLSPTYPFPHQKPMKLNLLLPDLVFALTLLLKNSGHMEKGVAISQAQLEFDFNFPEAEARKMENDKSGWKSVIKLFELFWGLETLRFGEPGNEMGWNQVLEINPDELGEKSEPIGVADSAVTEFVDEFFEGFNSSEEEASMKREDWKLARSAKWITIESLRSKLYWTPWRSRTSDADECEDSNRLVLPSEIHQYLIHIPSESCSDPFEKEAAHFRHTVNYLLLLSQDFLPRTHTLESILAPFSSISLSDSAVFFSELNYWEKLVDLYHSPAKGGGGLEIIPEGFQLPEFTLPSSSSILISSGKKLNMDSNYPESVVSQEQKLLETNQAKYHSHIRSVVTQSLEHLSPPFASLLVQMLFRYEQKSMYGRDEEHKEILAFAKNLMKHDKLRGSVEAYTEIGLLEYFGGKRKKAIGVLTKTLSSSCKLLKEETGLAEVAEDGSSLGDWLDRNWETVGGVTKLYRLVAEFHLKESRNVALGVLVSLGNHFDTVSLPGSTGGGTSSAPPVEEAEKSPAPSKTSILKAKRFYESVLNFLVPPTAKRQNDEDVVEIDGEDEAGGFEGLGKWDGTNCLEFFAQKSNLIVEWTLAYSLFSYLIEEIFEAPSEIYGRVMEKLENLEPLSRSNKYSSMTVCGHNIREQLYIGWCKLGALHVTLHPMQNSKGPYRIW